jgi:hypothetical protein
MLRCQCCEQNLKAAAAGGLRQHSVSRGWKPEIQVITDDDSSMQGTWSLKAGSLETGASEFHPCYYPQPGPGPQAGGSSYKLEDGTSTLPTTSANQSLTRLYTISYNMYNIVTILTKLQNYNIMIAIGIVLYCTTLITTLITIHYLNIVLYCTVLITIHKQIL